MWVTHRIDAGDQRDWHFRVWRRSDHPSSPRPGRPPVHCDDADGFGESSRIDRCKTATHRSRTASSTTKGHRKTGGLSFSDQFRNQITSVSQRALLFLLCARGDLNSPRHTSTWVHRSAFAAKHRGDRVGRRASKDRERTHVQWRQYHPKYQGSHARPKNSET